MNRRQGVEKSVQSGLVELRAIRDELRVQLHLAGMEAKTTWEKELEPRIHQAEKLAHLLSEEAQKTIEETLSQLKLFRGAMRAQKPTERN